MKDQYARANSAAYTFNFKFTTDNQDVSKATCYLYVSESDAVSSANSLGVATTTIDTTSTVHTVHHTTSGGSTGGINYTVTPATTQGSIERHIIPHTPRTNATLGTRIITYNEY